MLFAIILFSLYLLLLAYFKIANHFNIIDKPNSRSSHTDITIRGGGIIFPIAMLLYTVFFGEVSYLLLAGILMISLISFLDDVFTMPNSVRLLVHVSSVSLLLYSVNAFIIWPLWLIAIAYILVIGVINAYNFMDGINGITGLYSLMLLSFLLFVNETVEFTDPAFILVPMLACVVFLFFNFRIKARCFAGDVGSVSIAFWVVALLLMAILKSGDLEYILFLTAYGVDTILTILHRLILKERIFEAHRLHLYQIMANDMKIPHLEVALLTVSVQALINCFVVFTSLNFLITFLLSTVPLVLGYIVLKPIWMVKNEACVNR